MNFNNEENNDICLKYVALRIYNVLDFFLLYNWFADDQNWLFLPMSILTRQ